MRIRTIKPEFWTDSVMVRLPRDARLLFIGLWNAADDEGFISDDPEMIRMVIFPSDHELDVSLMLELLIAAGRVERVLTPEGKRLLYIAHWKDHQRIDHPAKSRLSREGSRKLAIPQEARIAVAKKYGCEPGCESNASCYYCGAHGKILWWKLSNGKPSNWVVFPDLELDHLIPENLDGNGESNNLVLACRSCNRSKGAIHPDSYFKKILASPREELRALAPEQGTGNREQGKDLERETGVSSQGGELFEQPQKQPDQPKPRKRDQLFDALVSACGGDPHQITARAARAAGVALAEIRKACPGVTPEQFARRAEVYRRKYRDAALTPSALCAHWAECDAGYVPAAHRAPDIEPAPERWREKLEAMCPGNLHNAQGRPWETLDPSIRAKLTVS